MLPLQYLTSNINDNNKIMSQKGKPEEKNGLRMSLAGSGSLRKSSLGEIDVEEESKKRISNNLTSINDLIGELDQKIQVKISSSEGKLLNAYKNHISKVARELKSLKEKHEDHEKKFSTDKEISHLMKQCALFRQEAMRLNSQLEDALDEVDIYKRKSEILDREVAKTNESMKEMIKKLKISQRQIELLRSEIAEKNITMASLQSSAEEVVQVKQNDESRKIKTQISEKKGKFKGSEIKIEDVQYEGFHTHNKSQEDITMNIFTNSLLKRCKPKTPHPTNTRYTHHSTFSSFSKSNKFDNQYTEVRTPTETRKNESKGVKEMIEKDIESFEQFISIIKEGRAKNSDMEQDNIESKTITEFLFSRKDIVKLSEKLFPTLTITCEKTSKGDHFIASKKTKERKSLTHLSTDLMKSIEKEKTEGVPPKKQYHSHHNLHDFSKFEIKKRPLFDEEFILQDKISKVESSFKKKKVGKTHRKLRHKEVNF